MIYLDNAATTQVSQEVLRAMIPYMTEYYGNAGSIHSMGRNAARAIEVARKQVALPINADPDSIIFTSGGSEANSLAIIGLSDYLRRIGKTHIITSVVEHSSVLEPIKYLFGNGFDVTYIPVDANGYVSPDDVVSAIHSGTGLVSIMGVNNETGNKMDIKAIGKICRANNVLFHTDCVQAYCNIWIDVNEFCIDLLSVSGHKIHAPKGVGFLYAKNKEVLRPIVFGGKQEGGIRAGTENVPGIVGFGVAAQSAYDRHIKNNKRYHEIRERFFDCLNSRCECYVNGDPHQSSRILNVCFNDIDSETLVLSLDSFGIVVSPGAACSDYESKPSHVLKALGLSDQQARSSIRISFSDNTTVEDVMKSAMTIADAVCILKGEK